MNFAEKFERAFMNSARDEEGFFVRAPADIRRWARFKRQIAHIEVLCTQSFDSSERWTFADGSAVHVANTAQIAFAASVWALPDEQKL